jgi:hypothetical protein
MSVFTQEEKRDMTYALQMWINYVQTRDVNLTQADAINMGRKENIRAITEEQMERILELKKLQKKVLSL